MSHDDRLPPDVESLIAAANEVDRIGEVLRGASPAAPVAIGPSVADGVVDELSARVWSGLAAKLGPEAALAPVGAGASAGAGLGLGAGVVVLSKTMLGVVLAAATLGGALVGAITVHVVSSSGSEAVAAKAATPPAVVAPGAVAVSEAVDESGPPPTAAAMPVPSVASASSVAPAGPTSAKVSPRGVADDDPLSRRGATPRRTPRARSPHPDEAAERLLLERARTALARGALDDAGRALRAHEKRYPRGRLLEDREALRVLLLYQRGDASAARADSAFRERFPHSLYRTALERAAVARGSAGAPAGAIENLRPDPKDPAAAPQSSR